MDITESGGVSYEAHNTTIPFPPMDSSFLTDIPFPEFGGVNDETQNATAHVPLMNTPLLMDIPFSESGSVSDETHNTATPLPVMVMTVQTITPFNDSNKDFFPSDAGPSIGVIKKGRGRPKGSKNVKGSLKKQKTYAANSRVVISNPNFNSGITEAEKENGNQEVVNLVLMRFESLRRRLCQLNCGKSVLTTALTNCRNLGVRTNTRKRIGPVPGVEMCLVGLHMQMVAGIDYLTVKDGATEGPLATSAVTSGHYSDETEEIEYLVYTGHGGTDKKGQAVDQKLVRGNLALKASKNKGNEVRVIRGEEDPNDKKKKNYIYDGLYIVSDYWTAIGKSGFEEYKFKLVRKPGQPFGYMNWKSAERWRKCSSDNSRKGLILADISQGREASSPVRLVNEIDENNKETPEDFSYENSQLFMSRTLDLHHRSIGCSDCYGRPCSIHEDPKCYCIMKNGGESPYLDQILVYRKPMVYKCGDSCACLLECKLRITQNYLKIRVEVFKTEKCGWGLRSLEPIRAGTSICEFTGMRKIIEEVEEDDEYVFDTSRFFNPFRWNCEPELVGKDCWEQVSEVYSIKSRLLISARRNGNVSRFINHSCSPNVMWQPIESEENREPCIRIAFFAMRHIPLLTELRYDYGMSQEVEEEDGIKVSKGSKICLCDSKKCRGSFG
ncbi:hypothetical protein EUTSA_v10029360mg [Eutrema salsugineum]|uniref:SET domain-containing protein n=1 Tax=Eutrema salsugineum TaxID=72664 RepID=V4LFH8_EUTSA|nr:hypothetical protein EUTSA_v10029360mg [Eutrema salsugineum]